MKHTRTHTCGELRTGDIQKSVTLMGWVNNRRDHGGLIFIDLRDRYGITQIVFNVEEDEALLKAARDLKSEYVVSVVGTVRERPDETHNSNMPTGDVEVYATEVEILSTSEVPPFVIDRDQEVNEDLRLTYRYLDLRRATLQRNMMIRHKTAQATREYLNRHNFMEIETPFLMKRTPEGARDYLVPSRLQWGSFYALPQSPQIYKQLLMLAGYDRYYQIVKCFRDEDLRSDRQPEFTQIDIETSFLHQNQILELIEGLVCHIYQSVVDIQIEPNFLKMPFAEAMNRFGSDKPDMRFGMELVDLNAMTANCGFKVFVDTVANGGHVKAIKLAGGAAVNRARLDKLTDTAKSFGAKGLIWIKVSDDGLQSPVAKFLNDAAQQAILQLTNASVGDLILVVADNWQTTTNVLGRLRLELAKEHNLIDTHQLCFLWVTDFPLLEWDEDEQRWGAMHHPFTSPREEDIPLFASDPGAIRAKAYDLVLNGVELGGGSIRIHRQDWQSQMFDALGMSKEEAETKFGFLLRAFQYGAPPHGGIALGFDRFVALLCGEDNIRQVIAFPKTNRATSPMDGAPAQVEEKLLKELGLTVHTEKKSS